MIMAAISIAIPAAIIADKGAGPKEVDEKGSAHRCLFR
jgi:hypothetical protein